MDTLARAYDARFPAYKSSQAESQILLLLQYRQMMHSGTPLPDLTEVGFKQYSQTDEDGILLYIFSLLGTTNRHCVELCVENGIECNSANLIINHGWHGLLFDGSAENIEQGRRYYRGHPQTWLAPPALAAAWIDRDNINSLIQGNGFEGGVDLLSVDIDGVDYWVFEAISCIQPNVVVVEINVGLGSEAALTVPYRPDFAWNKDDPTLRNYYGASLNAFVKLASKKGFRFVGLNRAEHNAFFVRRGLGEDVLPERHPREYLSGAFARRKQLEVQQDGVLQQPWAEV